MESASTQSISPSQQQQIVPGARFDTPRLSWPSEETMRENYRKLGWSEQKIDSQVESDLSSRKALRESALDFERYFVSLMMKEMKKGIKKNEMFHGGRGEEIFDGMLNHEYAKAMVNDKNSLGMADMIEQSLMRAQGGVAVSAQSANPLSASDTIERQAWSPEREAGALGMARRALKTAQAQSAYSVGNANDAISGGALASARSTQEVNR